MQTTNGTAPAIPVGGEPDNPRLDDWLRRTTGPLDMLALLTIWLTVVPLGAMHRVGQPFWWYVARAAISFVYFIDIAVRTRLSHRRLRYLLLHPVGVFSVVFPAVRLIFSLRLLQAMFRKGNLLHFLGVAALLFVNLAIIVFGFEHRAPGANIDTVGVSLWWACVTLFTVGYGDYYPITFGGRFFAVVLMALGLVTAAVITAQIASNFMDQAAARRAAQTGGEPSTVPAIADTPVHLEALAQRIEHRLDRLERLFSHHEEPAVDTED